MKLLKLYAEEQRKYGAYGTDSPLMKEIRNRYDCDEIVLPEGCTEAEKAEIIRDYDVLLTMWASPHVPNELADDPGKLRYICNITGEISKWIDREIVESTHITITNWGDAPAYGIAEGAMTLLLAVMKNIPYYIHAAGEGRTEEEISVSSTQGSLYKKRIGIYGLGAIGSRFVQFLKPFEPVLYGFDPYAKVTPEGVTMVDSLEELFDKVQILVVHAGLTDQTRGSVTKELLARLPDGGIVINTARGQIIDYDALKAELMSGRLRAGLDVVTENNLPDKSDPIRGLKNVIFSAHRIGSGEWGISPEELDIPATYCLENLERYQKGEPLKFVMTPARFRLST